MNRWLIAYLLWISVFSYSAAARADCQSDYNEALNLLNATQAKIQKNEHPNPDIFAQEFQKHVEKMKDDKCAPELKALLEHIQEEQKKVPVTPGEKPVAMPIMD